MSRAPWRAGPLTVPSFRAVWLSGLVSDGGDWLLFIALPLVVLERSGSAFGTSIAFLLELVPGALMTPVASWCAERLAPRRFLAGVAVAQGLALLPLLLVPSQGDHAALATVYGVIVVEAALTAASDPARNALLPRLVPADDLVGANALIGLAQNLARLVGGPLGGVVLAAGGLRVVALGDLASYLVAGVLLTRIDVVSGAADARRTGGRASTWSVLRLPPVRRTVAVTFGCQIAQGMFVVLFVLFVVRSLDGGSADVGLLRGVQAVGAIAGALVLAGLARRASPSALVALSSLTFGLLSLALWNGPSLTTTLWPYVAGFMLAGAPGVVLGTGLTSGLQTGVDGAAHGSAFALGNLASYAGQGVGILAAGLLVGPAGLRPVLDVQGAIYVSVGLLCTLTLRGAGPGPRARAVPRPARRAARA